MDRARSSPDSIPVAGEEIMKRLVAFALIAVAAQTAIPRAAPAQTVTRLTSDPARIEVTAGGSVPFVIRAYGPDGAEVAAPLRVGVPGTASASRTAASPD